MVQVLEDMLKICVIDLELNWERYLPLPKFSYNNNYQTNLGMSPFEALYGRRCRSPTCWVELSERKLVGPKLIREIEEKYFIIRNI